MCWAAVGLQMDWADLHGPPFPQHGSVQLHTLAGQAHACNADFTLPLWSLLVRGMRCACSSAVAAIAL